MLIPIIRYFFLANVKYFFFYNLDPFQNTNDISSNFMINYISYSFIMLLDIYIFLAVATYTLILPLHTTLRSLPLKYF